MLYVCLGYNLGLADVDGSVPIDFIRSGGCPWLYFFFLINVCGEKGGVQGILWPEQMHEASLGVVMWEEREFAAHLSSNLGKQN